MKILGFPLIILVLMSMAADYFLWAKLVDEHPLWLITLSSRNRYLLLTTNNLDALSFYGVGTLRLLAADPLFYLLGLFYGDRGIQWMEKRQPSIGGMVRQWEGWFQKASYPLVAIAPNNYICLFAGAMGMRPLYFAVLNIGGTIARLVVIRTAGDVFSEPIDSVLGFIGRYTPYIIAASVAVFAFTIWNDRRSGKQSELGALRDLEKDLGDDD